jgi:Flp pilus assembly protein TadB
MLLLAIFCLVNWEQTSLLFTTSAGLSLIGLGFVLQVLGFFTINRILDIEV